MAFLVGWWAWGAGTFVQATEPNVHARDSPAKTRPTRVEEPREANPSAKGYIDFETFRMLSTGMTEGEVLGRAGAPWHVYALTCDLSVLAGVSCPRRWVYTMDNEWMVEITFFRGQVININHFRTRP